MYNLTIIKQNGCNYIDSREVAEVTDKTHAHLLRDIRGYITIMEKNGLSKDGLSDYFLESNYFNAQNKKMPCYLISKMGAEIIANKLIGEKGLLFTIAYVKRFNEMENAEKEKFISDYTTLTGAYAKLMGEVEELSAMPAPRLGEYNACVRIIVRALRYMGATPDSIINFLKGVYEPLGIMVIEDNELNQIPQMYTAKQIAQKLGIYSLNGKPHFQAIASILNENIFIDDVHKIVETMDYGSHIGVCVRYDEYALQSVKNWLREYGYPSEVYGFDRTYRILYKCND